MDAQGGRRDQPAAVAGRRHRTIAVQKRQGHVSSRRCLSRRSRWPRRPASPPLLPNRYTLSHGVRCSRLRVRNSTAQPTALYLTSIDPTYRSVVPIRRAQHCRGELPALSARRRLPTASRRGAFRYRVSPVAGCRVPDDRSHPAARALLSPISTTATGWCARPGLCRASRRGRCRAARPADDGAARSRRRSSSRRNPTCWSIWRRISRISSASCSASPPRCGRCRRATTSWRRSIR